MVFLIVSCPVALAAAFIISPAIMCLGMFFISSQLLIAQGLTFVTYMYSFYSAGCCMLFRQSMVFMFPLILFWIASAAGVIAYGAGIPWMYVGVLFSLAKFSCIHVLYIIRPTWATMSIWLFLLTSAFAVLSGSLADGDPILTGG